MHFIGIDIGRTKITICLATEKGNIVDSKRLLTQPLNGAKNGIKIISQEIDDMVKRNNLNIKDIMSIGIGSPGPISSQEGKILNPPDFKGWQNIEIVKMFKEIYHKPTFMNNDANAACLAEWEFGSAKKINDLVYLTASTGMGGGVIVDGQLLQGITDTAGEIGHFVLDINGPKCPCGQNGCFEAYCGGANLARHIQTRIVKEKIKTKILDEAEGVIEQIDVPCLIRALKAKDAFAIEIWHEFIIRLAQGIGIIIQTLNPQAIILGTIAIHAQDLLLKPLKKELPRFCWKDPLEKCRIEPSSIGQNISELSAIALAVSGYNKILTNKSR
jgi:glucokinase